MGDKSPKALNKKSGQKNVKTKSGGQKAAAQLVVTQAARPKK
jgi:hypothetical protein